jgi:acyl carrier protein phosphodiesterase
MNYLAHCHLSGDRPSLLMGNFIADMINNREVKGLPSAWKRGIKLHRHIDSFTDQHPSVRKASAIIRDTQGKYAPVVTDVFYDYFLAKNWSSFADVDLTYFINNTYDLIYQHLDDLPPRIIPKVVAMVEDNFMHNYTTLAGIHKTMGFLNRRAKFKSGFIDAVKDLIAHKDELENTFLDFYPDLIQSIQERFLK